MAELDEIARAVEVMGRDLQDVIRSVMRIEMGREHEKEDRQDFKSRIRDLESRIATAEGKFQSEDLSKQISELRQQLSSITGELGIVKGTTMKGHNPRDPPKPSVSKAHVFISYSRLDERWVNERLIPFFRITPALRDVRYLLDTEHFEFGADFEEEINKALRNSKAVISVLSRNYLESDWATAENLAAKRIIPILIERCDLPITLSRQIYLDFTEDETSWPWDKLTGALLRI